MCLVVFLSEASPSPVKSSPETSPMTSPRQRRDSDRYCQLCNAWFNNPGMAQQHYDGKKHKKNAARADLLEQLGKTLDMGEMKGTEARMRRQMTFHCVHWDLIEFTSPCASLTVVLKSLLFIQELPHRVQFYQTSEPL